MTPTQTLDILTEPRHVGPTGGLVKASGLVGLITLVGSGLIGTLGGKGQAFFTAYLTNFVFFLTLCLGALFFVLIQHLTRSGWSVVVRRLAELTAANVRLLAVLVLPILAFGMKPLYEWMHFPKHGEHDPILSAKEPYLNMPFFIARVVIYFAAWILLSRYFLQRSVEQDATGDPKLTLRMQKWSAGAMFVFALTTTFAAFDLVMSLSPHWFSTIFGVYFFAGSVVGFVGFLILLVAFLQSRGKLPHAITTEHYHDLGKLLFAFTVFWAYIAFSQYMLIWYANIPEETYWYLARQTGAWTYVSLILLFGGFVLPFLGLISRVPKRKPKWLVIAAAWLLLLHWVDTYWLIVPNPHDEGHLELGVLMLTTFIGFAGLFLAGLAQLMKSCSLVPERDPRLAESLRFENI